MTMNYLNIQFTLPGAELMIAALRKLPHETVDPLVQEVIAQYKNEVARLQKIVAVPMSFLLLHCICFYSPPLPIPLKYLL